MRAGGQAPQPRAQWAQALGLSPAPLLKRKLACRAAAPRSGWWPPTCAWLVKAWRRNTPSGTWSCPRPDRKEGTIGPGAPALRSFDPTRGYKFLAPTPTGGIRPGDPRAIAEKSRTIRLPIQHHRKTPHKAKERSASELAGTGGVPPSLTSWRVAVEPAGREVKDLLCRARQTGEAWEPKVGDGEDTELLELLQGDGTLPEEKRIDNEVPAR